MHFYSFQKNVYGFCCYWCGSLSVNHTKPFSLTFKWNSLIYNKEIYCKKWYHLWTSFVCLRESPSIVVSLESILLLVAITMQKKTSAVSRIVQTCHLNKDQYYSHTPTSINLLTTKTCTINISLETVKLQKLMSFCEKNCRFYCRPYFFITRTRTLWTKIHKRIIYTLTAKLCHFILKRWIMNTKLFHSELQITELSNVIHGSQEIERRRIGLRHFCLHKHFSNNLNFKKWMNLQQSKQQTWWKNSGMWVPSKDKLRSCWGLTSKLICGEL